MEYGHHVPSLAARLASVDLFSGLDDDARERLVAAGATMTFRHGDAMTEQGKTDRTLYLLLAGNADVEINGALVGVLSEGSYFGEMALLDHEPRSATVRAGEGGAKAFAVSALAFETVLGDRPDIARALLVALTQRVRRLEAELAGREP